MKYSHLVVSALVLGSSLALNLSSASAATGQTLGDQDAIRLSYAALQQRASQYGLENAQAELQVRQVLRDQLRQTHVRLDQRYHGVPVFGEQLITHFDARGRLIYLNGSYRPIFDLSVKPTLSAGQALQLALADFAQPPSENPFVRLVVLPLEDGDAQLVWQVRLSDIESAQAASWTYFIDAHNGNIVWDFDSLETAEAAGTGESLYSGLVDITTSDGVTFTMVDPTRGDIQATDMKNTTSGMGIVFTDDDNAWGNGLNIDPNTAGVDAFLAAELTWDYLLEHFDRRGLRDDRKGHLSRVHYSSNYVNAFWSDDCFCLTVGDGDNSTSGPLVALDIMAHEAGHGLTSSTAGLVYSGQSGALNESYSDILGTMVEYYGFESGRASGEPDYMVGEDAWTPGKEGDALRYMDDPTKDKRSIDHASKWKRWQDVHYTSGLSNNVFYLLAEGGTNKTSGQRVPLGIGREKAYGIFYRALVTYLGPNSNWSDARKQTIKAATDLYTQAEADVVAQAWAACGVNR